MIFMSGSRHDSSWMNDPALRDRIMEIRKAATWSMDNVLQECLDNRTHLVALLDPSLQQAQALGVTFEETKNRFLQSLDIDYDELSNLGNRLIARLSKAQHIHVTSPKGTDLTLNAVGRSWINDDGRTPRPKGVTPYIGNIPVGEIFVAPLEDSPVGVFAPEDFPGSPVHDVRIEFKKGQNATFVAGEGNEILQARLSRATGNPYVLGEFAIGTNPCGDPLLATEKAYATVHMAMGQNTWLGGKNECSVHMDMLVDKPTVEVDGEFILRDGKFWV
jgi:leucyl aminopeptidase (aminopeptidase T)